MAPAFIETCGKPQTKRLLTEETRIGKASVKPTTKGFWYTQREASIPIEVVAGDTDEHELPDVSRVFQGAGGEVRVTAIAQREAEEFIQKKEQKTEKSAEAA